MDLPVPHPHRARPAAAAIGWRLDDDERAQLLARFPPAYPEVLASHVTLKTRARPRERLPEPCEGRVIGQVDDGRGVQCLVIEVDGELVRWDGGVFHLCWSIDRARGRRLAEAEGVIAWLGWTPVEPVTVRLVPARF